MASRSISGSGNFNRLGGPSFNPDHTSKVFPSSLSIDISNAPLLGFASPPFITDSISELATNGEADRRAT